ncbi:MAG: histidine kinase [Herbinix sp.]|jgi:signal transduction histidine kinase|nr:histidine kinase [Herbinix sp.]
MNLLSYINDKIIAIILQILGIVAISLFIISLGNSIDAVFLIVIGWGIVALLYYSIDYIMRKRYFKEILSCADQLDKKYLLSDVIQKPRRLEDIIYRKLLFQGNKAMLEEIANIRHERDEYKEYIEQWIHEVKTPLAAMKLICENNRSSETIKLLRELERANQYVEQVLFYARSEHVEKDYLIREINLTDAVKKSVLNHKQLLLEHQMQIEINCDSLIFTDIKWLVFILDQCIANSIKYGATKLTFQSNVIGKETCFSIIDNGIGIAKEDLPRIFEKSFTGKNGHEQEKSAGIGLYLCKKLCDRLGIDIKAESQDGSYTKIIITFF